MKKTKSLSALLLAISFLFTQRALAVPVFQVYIEDAAPGAVASDEDTWLTTSDSFDLIVAGAYRPKTKGLTDVTLLICVPQDETGTIFITGGDGATLLTEETPAADGCFNPNADATLDLLINEAGNSEGCDGYPDKSFLPEGAKFNSHYPLNEKVSDFLLYEIGDFDRVSNAVSNYSAGEPIAHNIADGQEKTFAVSISGFTTVHFDVYGYMQTSRRHTLGATWAINPGSHGATSMVPEPATVLLLGLGMTVLLKPGRRSRARSSS